MIRAATKFSDIVVVLVLSLAALAISLFLSADLTPTLAPITQFSTEYSYWVAFEIKSPVFDAWFDSDPQIVLANLTQSDHAHFSLYKHPIFSLLFFPITWVLVQITGDVYLGVRLLFAINAFIGTALLGALAWRLKLRAVDVALCCLVFLASSTMMFWYTVPEKFPLGATTFLACLHLAMSATPKTIRGYLVHAAISMVTFAITVTNWVVALLTTAAVFGLFDRPLATLRSWLTDFRRAWSDLKIPVLITAGVLVATAVLAVVQDQFFGQASLFFNISHYLKESSYMAEYFVTPAWMRPVSIFTGPIVLGTLETWHYGARLTGDNITPSTLAGWIAMPLWVLLLLRGTAVSIRFVARASGEFEILVRRMLIVAFISLFLFTILHSIYGYVTFLYIAHITPFVLVLFMMNFTPAGDRLLGFDTIAVVRVMAVALVVTAAINNYDLLMQASGFIDERIRLGIPQQ